MPSLRAAAKVRGEARIATQSSMARGRNPLFLGGGLPDPKYYIKSSAGSLGGNSSASAQERYHQSKLANLAFAMALHAKFNRAEEYANFKAVSAAPGFSE